MIGGSEILCQRCHAVFSIDSNGERCPYCRWNPHPNFAEKLGAGLCCFPLVIALLHIVSGPFSFDKCVFYAFLLFVIFRATIWPRTGLSYDEPIAALNIGAARNPLERSTGRTIASVTTPPSYAAPDRAVHWDDATFQKYRYLMSLAKPRSIELSEAGQKAIVILPVGASIFALVAGLTVIPNVLSKDAGLAKLSDVLFLVFCIIFATTVTLGVRKQFLDRNLLVKGELTLGRVISHYETGGRHRSSRIAYRYQLPSGSVVEGFGTDLSRILRIGAPVPVFYDRESPARHIAEYCSYWQIVPSVVVTQRS